MSQSVRKDISIAWHLLKDFMFSGSSHSGAVAWWLSMRNHNTGVVSSIHPCVISKTPLVRKATGNHLMNSTSLQKTQGPVSGFCYARNRVYHGICIKRLLARKVMGNHLMNSISLQKTQSPVFGFCYARNRVCNAGSNKTSMLSLIYSQ